MLEHRMVMDSEWRNLERQKTLWFENAVSQPECCGIDFYGSEVLEGDEIAIDHDHVDEIILKENLVGYCAEVLGFVFHNGVVFVKNPLVCFKDENLEKYLHEEYNFEFKVAD